ncbi:P-loop containing nucleoside triphosphate hydrolase protein [Lojkania enalia]|uniref:P-loop containing nucleoside triphosphate hydrolase protein n=1 Tax=Lojkania enalia TaxID=147567 RepID=A0A9P4N7L5_9PLEO|nr:P-loop containing nucleoside triphosphate hydrolase protein [Didymosphaeria enalia]
MGTLREPTDYGATVTAGSSDDTFRLRSYQAEMVEESLRANIIVAMDTGSGKTHIALRLAAAVLEICNPEQLVWFLVPTVALCEQQGEVFKSNLPAYGIKTLSGNDDVDRWTDQNTWDTVLKNVRVVLSTHQVLLDALTHAFVKMSRLALIIFDEAHHCSQNHPANKIMKDFYKPFVQENSGFSAPRILGLTASPIMRANVKGGDLEKIEENLCSVAKSPKVYRSELIRFVHKPKLLKVTYPLEDPSPSYSDRLAVFLEAYNAYDLTTDPYIVELRRRIRQGDEEASQKLRKVYEKFDTYCYNQLKSIVKKAKAIHDELGYSTTDWYLLQCISKYQNAFQNSDQQLYKWSHQERDHLMKIFNRLLSQEDDINQPISLKGLSRKVDTLVDILVTETRSEFTGLVFVEQRVWVAALAEILSTHPRTKDLFNLGTFVGSSQSFKRKTNIADLAEPRNQQNILDDFRAGRKNIILATSALEEGIDVTSCHLVICFERPKNLKSFIQRRGRARKEMSKYIIMLSESDQIVGSPERWQALEQEMVNAYLSDVREVRAAEERERTDDQAEMFYKVPNTGALLTLDNASPHLHHFCSSLSLGAYVDSRPQFTFSKDEVGRITAEVLLPLSIDPAYREFKSEFSWNTERMAKNEAAFQAYKALHQGGLVNDNLLPSHEVDIDEEAEFNIPSITPSLVEVSSPYDPWVVVAKCQQQNPRAYHRILLELKDMGSEPLFMVLMTPRAMPEIPEVPLYWNKSRTFSIKSSRLPDTVVSEEGLDTLRAITWKLLYSVFYSRMQEKRRDFLWLLFPCESRDLTPDYPQLRALDVKTDGHDLASVRLEEKHTKLADWGLVSIQGDARKYIVQGINHEKHDGVQLQVARMPKRRDFLHRVVERNEENGAYSRIDFLNAKDCVVSNLPAAYSIFALFVPSMLHKYETHMVVETLRTTILEPVTINPGRLDLIVSAITSSGTGEESNYQRLEFLGDCILKFIASVHLMAAHLTWPESFLTKKKGKIVSNGFLARATKTIGLDRFIITKRFTGAKWQPKYVGDLMSPPPAKEKILRSSKLLADVIESLIGLSYIEGGFDNALICTQTLLPLEQWTPIPDANDILFKSAPSDVDANHITMLEKLIGYTFNKKVLLLEAVTHASYNGPNARCSYERLEFLGDAVLDYIISKRLYLHTPDVSHQKMHAIRTSMANAAFLTFRMFETTVEQIVSIDTKTMQPETKYFALWQFMRHNSSQLRSSRETTLQQHAACRERVIDALQHDAKFPWHLLALTDAPKYFSDIVESVIGAIYIDSQGSISACEIFVRRLGILNALERILRDEVDCLHPKERLGHLAVELAVQYVRLDPEEGNKMYKCQVRVGDKDVGCPVEGLKRLNAETIAAWKAIRIIEGLDHAGMSEIEDYTDDEWHDAKEGVGE